MAEFTAVVANGRSLRRILGDIRCWWQLKSRMHEFAARTVGAKASKIILAKNSSNVAMATGRSVTAKAPVIPSAVFDF